MRLRRRVLICIYVLGILGVIGSGGGGGDDDCFPSLSPNCGPIIIPPTPSAGTVSFNAAVKSIAPAVDSSDDIYVGGIFTVYKNTDTNFIARLNSDLSLDTGFDIGTGFNSPVLTVAPATDGSGDVYVGGGFTDYNGTTVNFIVRLNVDGTIDTNFDIGTGFDAAVEIIAVAVDGSDDVYVGGDFTTYDGTMVGDGLIRLNDDGTLDTGFSTGSGWGQSIIAPATDGSGDVYVARDTSPYIARLDDDGSVDAGFDTGVSSFNNNVRSVAAANDGSNDIFVAGFFDDYNGSMVNRLTRLNDDGSLDSGFTLSPGFRGQGDFITPAIDGSGDVYVDSRTPTIIRLNADGSRDTDFDLFLDLNDRPDAVAIALDGSNDVFVGAGQILTNSNFLRLDPFGN